MAAPRAPDAADGALSGSARTRPRRCSQNLSSRFFDFLRQFVDAGMVGGATCGTGQLGPDRVGPII